MQWRVAMVGEQRGSAMHSAGVAAVSSALKEGVSGEDSRDLRRLVEEAEGRLAAYTERSEAEVAGLRRALESGKERHDAEKLEWKQEKKLWRQQRL